MPSKKNINTPNASIFPFDFWKHVLCFWMHFSQINGCRALCVFWFLKGMEDCERCRVSPVCPPPHKSMADFQLGPQTQHPWTTFCLGCNGNLLKIEEKDGATTDWSRKRVKEIALRDVAVLQLFLLLLSSSSPASGLLWRNLCLFLDGRAFKLSLKLRVSWDFFSWVSVVAHEKSCPKDRLRQTSIPLVGLNVLLPSIHQKVFLNIHQSQVTVAHLFKH